MSRIVIPARARLVYVESRGWLLGKLGIKVLVIAGVIFVWGPLLAGRPHAMRLVGWLVWAAIALLAVGAVVRIVEAVWARGVRLTCSSVRWRRPWRRRHRLSGAAPDRPTGRLATARRHSRSGSGTGIGEAPAHDESHSSERTKRTRGGGRDSNRYFIPVD